MPSTAEDVIKAVRGKKEADKCDPLNQLDHSDLDNEPAAAALSEDERHTSDASEVQSTQTNPESPPSKNAKNSSKKGKDPTKNFHMRAESLLNVGMATAKMHMQS